MLNIWPVWIGKLILHGQEDMMPIQDLFAAQAQHEKIQEEKAIIRAMIRYFETAPAPGNAALGEMESSIVNALHRYFDK
jgi:hypothetical protein